MIGRRQREAMASLRAEVNSLQARLSSDIATLQDNGDPVCRQALSDAAERSGAADSLLAAATGPGEMQVARRVVIEGLTATRLVREKQGLPLGADLPPLGASTVDEPTAVDIDGERHVAHPSYHPDQPHFFGGQPGAPAPAGYYATPWWKKALAIGGAVVGAEMVGDVVGDMFGGGGGFGGGGFGGGDWDGGGGGDWDGGDGGD